jgi:DNA polymerase zeta
VRIPQSIFFKYFSLSVWRILRSEIAESSYTIQKMTQRILNFRFPRYSPRLLYLWFQNSGTSWRAINFFLEHVSVNHALAESMNIIGRTSELARLFGIEFYDVLSRGSQFRVESMLLRLAKPENFLMLSPSRAEVSQQQAPECVPLVMEPMSEFYSDPVLVLDFRSLYPSIIIAYNIW